MKLDKDQPTELDVTKNLTANERKSLGLQPRQSEPPTVRDIVRQYLTDHVHDGLCNPSLECGCSMEYLMCCEMSPFGCQPARRVQNEYNEEIYVLDDRPAQVVGPRITGGFRAETEDDIDMLYPEWTCPNCGQTMPGNGFGGPLYYHDCKGGATIECACCHQVVGISQAVYQNGLCPKCAEEAK
jgi:hypothetical protein